MEQHAQRQPSIIDLEASGFGVDSYPIEVGVVNAYGERYCSLIKPEPTWQYWSKRAERIHGISREMLHSCGEPVEVVCRDLNRFLDGQIVYSDAWVHDKPWLSRLYFTARMEPSFYCSPIENILTEAQLEIWDQTKEERLQQLKLRRHRASSDAFLVQQTFVHSAMLLRRARGAVRALK